MKKYLAEMIGTMVLVLMGCGSAVFAGSAAGAVSAGVGTLGVAFAFGLSVVAMAYAIGGISGCHINPAVSLAMAIRKEITWQEFGFFVLSQVLGGFVGAILLGICLRGNFEALGGNVIQGAIAAEKNLDGTLTYDAWSYIDAFLVEVFLTFIFVIAILGVTDKKHHDGKLAGIVIGFTLALVHLLGLGFTGTSVNPARSLAPAILQAIAGDTTSLSQIWIWILAPFAGAALAAVCYSFLSQRNEYEGI